MALNKLYLRAIDYKVCGLVLTSLQKLTNFTMGPSIDLHSSAYPDSRATAELHKVARTNPALSVMELYVFNLVNVENIRKLNRLLRLNLK